MRSCIVRKWLNRGYPFLSILWLVLSLTFHISCSLYSPSLIILGPSILPALVMPLADILLDTWDLLDHRFRDLYSHLLSSELLLLVIPRQLTLILQVLIIHNGTLIDHILHSLRLFLKIILPMDVLDDLLVLNWHILYLLLQILELLVQGLYLLGAPDVARPRLAGLS